MKQQTTASFFPTQFFSMKLSLSNILMFHLFISLLSQEHELQENKDLGLIAYYRSLVLKTETETQ